MEAQVGDLHPGLVELAHGLDQSRRAALHGNADAARPAVDGGLSALEVVEGLLPKLEVQRAITSGYLERDDPSVAGWQRIERRVRDGWAADLLEFRP